MNCNWSQFNSGKQLTMQLGMSQRKYLAVTSKVCTATLAFDGREWCMIFPIVYYYMVNCQTTLVECSLSARSSTFRFGKLKQKRLNKKPLSVSLSDTHWWYQLPLCLYLCNHLQFLLSVNTLATLYFTHCDNRFWSVFEASPSFGTFSASHFWYLLSLFTKVTYCEIQWI